MEELTLKQNHNNDAPKDEENENENENEHENENENEDNLSDELNQNQIIRAYGEERMNENNDNMQSTQKYNCDDIEVNAAWSEDKDNINVIFKKNDPAKRLILHWGVYKQYPINEWHHPNKEDYPKETKEFDDFALETEFVGDGNESKIELKLPKNDAKGLSFVFYDPYMNVWYNNCLKDYQIQFIY